MTVRDNVHQLVDTLPEERLADVLDYLAELKDGEEPLTRKPKPRSKRAWTICVMGAPLRLKSTGGHAACEISR